MCYERARPVTLQAGAANRQSCDRRSSQVLSNPAARRRPRCKQTAKNDVEVSMKNLARKIRGFLGSEDGATAVEYAVMVALIIAACITTVNIMGTDVNNTFDKVNQALPT